MNKFIESYVKETYGIDVNTATADELSNVTEIITSSLARYDKDQCDWDYSLFPKIKKIDCSFNCGFSLNISSNHELEYIRFEGNDSLPAKMDFPGNPHLKTVISGQDHIVELDFSNNYELEKLRILLNSGLRWLNVSKCPDLKSVHIQGANIPFVDLTNCHNLEYVNINYWNLYKNKEDEYGDGFPRPFVFVDQDFDEKGVVDSNIYSCKYFAYYLIKVAKGSVEEEFLNRLLNMKDRIVAIPLDYYGRDVARLHYELLDLYKSMKSSPVAQG